jgi:hypothetical protein
MSNTYEEVIVELARLRLEAELKLRHGQLGELFYGEVEGPEEDGQEHAA